MANWLRKLRGVLGIGLSWGLPATVVGLIGGVVASVVGGGPLLPSLATGAAMVGGLFFLLGTGFALALTLTEGRRTLHELTPRRASVWGAVAGGWLPVVTVLVSTGSRFGTVLADPELLAALLGGVASCGALGAALAGGTVAVARQAPAALRAGSVGGDEELLSTSGRS